MEQRAGTVAHNGQGNYKHLVPMGGEHHGSLVWPVDGWTFIGDGATASVKASEARVVFECDYGDYVSSRVSDHSLHFLTGQAV